MRMDCPFLFSSPGVHPWEGDIDLILFVKAPLMGLPLNILHRFQA